MKRQIKSLLGLVFASSEYQTSSRRRWQAATG